MILFGEHFVVHGSGAVLCAINKRATVTAEASQDDGISIRSAMGGLELGRGADAPDAGPVLGPLYRIADRVLESESAPGGMVLTVESDIPPGAGLGSSSACCVAAAAAASGLYGGADRDAVMELATWAERTALAGASGADCAASVHGGIISYRAGEIRQLGPCPGLRLVIADSGTEHSTAAMVARVGALRDADPGGFAALCSRAADLVAAAPGLLAAGDIRGLGAAASENQALLEAAGVSSPALEGMIGAARGASYGSKITGAGGGGCTVSIADGGNVRAVLDALAGAGAGRFEAAVDCRGLDTF